MVTRRPLFVIGAGATDRHAALNFRAGTAAMMAGTKLK